MEGFLQPVRVNFDPPDIDPKEIATKVCVPNGDWLESDFCREALQATWDEERFMALEISDRAIKDDLVLGELLPQFGNDRRTLAPVMKSLSWLNRTESGELEAKLFDTIHIKALGVTGETASKIRKSMKRVGLIDDNGKPTRGLRLCSTVTGRKPLAKFFRYTLSETQNRLLDHAKAPIRLDDECLERTHLWVETNIFPEGRPSIGRDPFQNISDFVYYYLKAKDKRRQLLFQTSAAFHFRGHKLVEGYYGLDRATITTVRAFNLCGEGNLCVARDDLHRMTEEHRTVATNRFVKDRDGLIDLGILGTEKCGAKTLHCPTDIGFWTITREFFVEQVCNEILLEMARDFGLIN